MKYWILALILISGSLAAPLYAQGPSTAVGKQIVALPEDGQTYYTTVYLPATRSHDAIATWFDSHPYLAGLKAQTHFHVYYDNSPEYRDRYRTAVPVVPAVTVQTADGAYVYKAVGDAVPTNPDALAWSIQTGVYTSCPLFQRRQPEPSPGPEPPATPPSVTPVTPAPSPDVPWLLYMAALAGGVLAGVGMAYYDQYYKNSY